MREPGESLGHNDSTPIIPPAEKKCDFLPIRFEKIPLNSGEQTKHRYKPRSGNFRGYQVRA